LALGGWGRVAPNPLVGAVLLKNGQAVGEGYHAGFGEPHAEAVALRTSAAPKGATLVINLEPCSHQGKTPPCVNAIIEAGIKRVVIAVRDPNPEAAGGVEKLQAAGVEVEVGLLAGEAAALNAPFLWSFRRSDRPFLAVKVATSLDGFLADASGRAKSIGSALASMRSPWAAERPKPMIPSSPFEERSPPECLRPAWFLPVGDCATIFIWSAPPRKYRRLSSLIRHPAAPLNVRWPAPVSD
jgi:riboflavin biosynthesis protein RibD